MARRWSPIWTRHTDEEFSAMFHDCRSVTELLAIYGLLPKGGNTRTLRSRCDELGLDYKSKCIQGIQERPGWVGRISNEEMFTSDSSIKRGTVKKRIIDEGLIPYVCGVCGQEPWWNNSPMVLILDHINGVHNDNRIENLRFVCGNCNIQLSTNAGKNSVRYYRVEKKEADPNWRRALKPNQRKIEWPPTEDLIDMVLMSSYLAVGKKLGVSDNSVRKHLQRQTGCGA